MDRGTDHQSGCGTESAPRNGPSDAGGQALPSATRLTDGREEGAHDTGSSGADELHQGDARERLSGLPRAHERAGENDIEGDVQRYQRLSFPLQTRVCQTHVWG